MKNRQHCLLLPLLAASLLATATAQTPIAAAASKAIAPVLFIQEVETSSPETYAMLIAEVNKAVKQKLGVDNYVKLFVGDAAGPDTGKVFAVSGAESFQKAAENSTVLEQELALAKTRVGLSQIRKLGSQVALRCVRWEGRHPDCAVLNTRVVLNDEAAYLKMLDGLRTLMDAHGLQDIKLNCMRVVSGRSDYTHLISLNCPSTVRRGALMDAFNEPWAIEWVAAAAKYRTVVANGSYREITK